MNIKQYIIGILALIWILFATGCASDPAQVSKQCDTWLKVVALYDVAVASGHKPSEDETRVYTTAKALAALYCSTANVGLETKAIGKIQRPPEPKTLTVSSIKYKLVVPFSVLDTQGESVFKGLKDVTLGPLYKRVKPRGEGPSPTDEWLYLPDAAYLVGINRRPTTMHPIRP